MIPELFHQLFREKHLAQFEPEPFEPVASVFQIDDGRCERIFEFRVTANHELLKPE